MKIGDRLPEVLGYDENGKEVKVGNHAVQIISREP